jgi:hypothetical protein
LNRLNRTQQNGVFWQAFLITGEKAQRLGHNAVGKVTPANTDIDLIAGRQSLVPGVFYPALDIG